MEDLTTLFSPGLDLAEAFYRETVSPILHRHFPRLAYSAAKIHRGSEVLGFDTPRSMDHDWGPSKLDLFMSAGDCERLGERIGNVLAEELPHEFRGLPTDFIGIGPGVHGGTIGRVTEGPVSHRIVRTTIEDFFEAYIGLNPLEGMDEIDWLVVAPQYLRTIASGRVFHDGLGRLEEARRLLEWYPRDVWLYLLSSQWRRIEQEEPFMARCGEVGDDLGSRTVAARMVEELMRLCFLMERQYWPYCKWFGSAFARLECAEALTPVFRAVHDSQDWKTREKHLSLAYLHVAGMHNDLGITAFIEPRIEPFFGRPYLIPWAGRFSAALIDDVESRTVRDWPRGVGAVAQFVHSTDVLDWIDRSRKLRALYEQGCSGRPGRQDDG